MTQPLYIPRYPAPRPVERDPADDAFEARDRPAHGDDGCRDCGATLTDLDWTRCELCRYAVQDEGKYTIQEVPYD